jgi:hypothetical protein
MIEALKKNLSIKKPKKQRNYLRVIKINKSMIKILINKV